ncbi:MAG TPA: hypothetical protein VK034_31790 [Enhygromyxa sp.]|nr:hypothetical protein [Enhygromyxa sp.]
MFDNKVLKMSPGEALLDAPIADMVQKLGIAIAEAQLRMDQVGVRIATMLADARVDFTDAEGNVTTKNLLQLGFLPTFYHFTETTIEVKLTMSMKVEEGFSITGSVDLGSGSPPVELPASDNRAVMWGVAIDVGYHRKYEFNMSGSSSITTKMVSVPAPTAFLDQIRASTQVATPSDG